jgi:hypothetical protein
MDEHSTVVALLFSTEPTDRALAGWRPTVWLALGDRAVYRLEWKPVSRWAPYCWTMRWDQETPPRSAQQAGQTATSSA